MTILKADGMFFGMNSVVLWGMAGDRVGVRLTGGHVVYLNAGQAVAFIRAMGKVELINLGRGTGSAERNGRAPEGETAGELSLSG